MLQRGFHNYCYSKGFNMNIFYRPVRFGSGTENRASTSSSVDSISSSQTTLVSRDDPGFPSSRSNSVFDFAEIMIQKVPSSTGSSEFPSLSPSPSTISPASRPSSRNEFSIQELRDAIDMLADDSQDPAKRARAKKMLGGALNFVDDTIHKSESLREKALVIQDHSRGYKAQKTTLLGIAKTQRDLLGSQQTEIAEKELEITDLHRIKSSLENKNAALQTQQLRMHSRVEVPSSDRPFITLPPAERDTTDLRKAMAMRDRAKQSSGPPSPTSD